MGTVRLVWSLRTAARIRDTNWRSLIVAVSFAVSLASCSDPNARANALFVKAQQLVAESETQPPEQRLATLQEAQADMKKIVDDYPSSNLAVQIASGRSDGSLSVAAINLKIAEAEPAAEEAMCLRAPTRSCLNFVATRAAMADTDDEQRVTNLASLAEAQAKAGEKEFARETASRAKDLADGVSDDKQKVGAESQLVRAQASAGDLSGAIATTAGIANSIYSSGAVRDIANILTEVGRLGDAISIVADCDDGYERTEGRLAIANYLNSKGDKAGASQQVLQALSAANSISDSSDKEIALQDVAKGQAELGQFSDAMRTAAQIGSYKNDFFRTDAVEAIAEEEAKAGQTSAAMQLAQQLDADAQDAGEYKSTLEINVTQVHVAVAAEQAKEGRFDLAYQTAASISDGTYKAYALGDIAVAQTRAGHLRDAYRTVDGIEPDHRPLELGTIARAQAEMGQLGPSKRTIEMAAAGDCCDWALEAIADAQIKSRQPVAAVETAQRISDNGRRAAKLADISAYLRD
jgi:hypothetical protein